MNKEEAKKQRKQLGKVEIPEGTEKWSRWVAKDGTVWTQPFGNRILSEEEIKRREEVKKKKAEERVKKQTERAAAKLEYLKKAEERAIAQQAKRERQKKELEAKLLKK